MFHKVLPVACRTLAAIIIVTGVAAGASAQPFPTGWTAADVGDVGKPGTSSAAGGVWSISGAGADVWGNADAFQFAYTTVDNDTDIYALVESEQSTHPFAKAGLMIRQSLAATSDHVLIDVKPDGGIEVLTRRFPHGDSTTFVAGADAALPVWLKLSRTGESISVFVASTSVCPAQESSCSAWTPVATGVPFWPGRALVGMAVTSHDPLVLNAAVFKSVHTTQLTQPWTQGNAFSAGDATAAAWSRDGVFHVPGIGTDIWGTQDDFEFVSRSGRGDSEIVARVVQLQNTSPFAKAGVMMRANAGDSSAHVLLDVKPDGGIEFMTRRSFGGETEYIAGAAASIPVWLRLVRQGDQVDGYISNNGTDWQLVGTATVTLTEPDPNPGQNTKADYKVGLAATSHDPDHVNDTEFDHVSISGLRPQFDGPNLIQKGTFEEYAHGPLGAPWISDRDVAAVVESAHPHSGAKNAACRPTATGDCGVYQEITLPLSGAYIIRFFANAEGPGAIVGIDVNGRSLTGGTLDVREPGTFESFGWGIQLRPGDSLTIRVWLYVPAGSGGAVIDDVSVTAYSGPT